MRMERAELMELMQDRDYRTDIYKVGVFRFPSSYKFERHEHEEIEINYVAAGCCLMGIGDEFVPMKKGECIIIYRHTPHSFMVNLKQSCRLTQLEMKIQVPARQYENRFLDELGGKTAVQEMLQLRVHLRLYRNDLQTQKCRTSGWGGPFADGSAAGRAVCIPVGKV